MLDVAGFFPRIKSADLAMLPQASFGLAIYCGKMAGCRRQIFIPSAVEIPTQRWYQLPAREYSRRELIADRLVNFGGLFGVDLYEPALVICPPRSELLASA